MQEKLKFIFVNLAILSCKEAWQCQRRRLVSRSANIQNDLFFSFLFVIYSFSFFSFPLARTRRAILCLVLGHFERKI
jgi:hypothetical protein